MIKIKMLTSKFSYTRDLIWKEGQEFEVPETDNLTFYKLVEKNTNMYGVSKDAINKLFVVC